jgi:RNA polymerase sigma-70 factor (ECF subfamily)
MHGVASCPMTAAESAAPADPALELAAVYARWYGEVGRWARALGGPSAELEDIAQEVFVIVRRKLRGFDGRNLAGWLYRITARTARDHRRAAWFRRLVFGGDEGGAETAGGATPLESLERREAQRTPWRLLGRLGEKQRSVFVLFEIEGYSGEEIAALPGIPVATVWTRMHYARRALLALAAELKREEK